MAVPPLRLVRRADARLDARAASDYELLAPRMLGLALLAPYFLWMIGRIARRPAARAARPVGRSCASAFVALLALGLARLARTATTQKVCTVYLVDVSRRVPDAALEDARAEVQKALDAKPTDDLVRLVTFAKRPRVVPLARRREDRCRAIERHDAPRTAKTGLGAATDIASALQLAYGLYPGGLPAARGHPLRRRADRRRPPRRGEPRARFGVKLFAVPYHAPRPGRGRGARASRVPDKVRVGETVRPPRADLLEPCRRR